MDPNQVNPQPPTPTLTSVPPPVTVTNTINPSKKGIPKVFKVAGIIVAIIAIFFIVVFFIVNTTTAEPLKVSDQFISYVQNKDLTSAEALIVDKFSKEDLRTFADGLPPFSKAEVGEKQISTSDRGTFAVFIYKVTASDNSIFYLKVQVEKVENTWKIFNLRTSSTELEADLE